MSSPVNTVVFDLGGVLVDWKPAYLYDRLIPDENERQNFLTNICSFAWHENHDVGVTFADNAVPLLRQHSDPRVQKWIKAWDSQFFEMFGGPIAGTVEILQKLSAAKIELFALTNWPTGKFGGAKQMFPFLNLFKDVVVSSDEKVKKPDPAIYDILVRRGGFDPARAVYIDDLAKNLPPAERLGLRTVHFTTPDVLATRLRGFGLVL